MMPENERQLLFWSAFMVSTPLLRQLRERGVEAPVIFWHFGVYQCATALEATRVMQSGGWQYRAFPTDQETMHYGWKLQQQHGDAVFILPVGKGEKPLEEPMLPLDLPEVPKPRRRAGRRGAWLLQRGTGGEWQAVFDRFGLHVRPNGEAWQWRVRCGDEEFAQGESATKQHAQAAATFAAFRLCEAEALDLDMQSAIELRAQHSDRRGRPRARGSAVRGPPRDIPIIEIGEERARALSEAMRKEEGSQ
jgi:hypothetical protein